MPTPISRALLSVSDKTGLVSLGLGLAERGVEIVSTGGSATVLSEAGIPVRDVSDVTGFPEILSGRVKTLHPNVHGGILGVRGDEAHRRELDTHAIRPIDLVVANLYPFEQTAASGADIPSCIEQIDVGGPSMLRAAAKNYADVTVVCDPEDYAALVEDLEEHDGATSLGLRERLAAKVFARTAAYDAAIAAWFAARLGEPLPDCLALGGTRRLALRYGENPHQAGALYVTGQARPGVATARQVQGKDLSYNNLADADAAYELVAEFESPAAAIVKHANPSGAALGATVLDAYQRALACDQVSAFGGVVAANRPLDRVAAEEVAKIFTEVVIAPGADASALEVFAGKPNLRVLVAHGVPDSAAPGLDVRSLAGGLLAQGRDRGRVGPADLRVVTRRAPTDAERRDLMFAWRVCKHVKSNAVVFARDVATIGIGAGQMSRLDAVRLAARKAEDAAHGTGGATRGTALASDAFFPFADALVAAAEAGATAVIQPGGSMRDREVIAAADEAGLAMVFTGMRHFRH